MAVPAGRARARPALGDLPRVPPRAESDPALSGFLLRGRAAGEIRFATGTTCLTLAVDDVVAFDRSDCPEGVEPAAGLPGRLTLRRGARLLAAEDSEPYRRHLLRTQQPFALRVRPRFVDLEGTETYAVLERDFFAAHGLEPPPR